MYKLTKSAEKDIADILSSSIKQFGVEQTDKYVASLIMCVSLLGSHPDMGTNVSALRRGYYKFPHESHVIFYKIESDYVLIVRVLHKHMDVEKMIK